MKFILFFSFLLFLVNINGEEIYEKVLENYFNERKNFEKSKFVGNSVLKLMELKDDEINKKISDILKNQNEFLEARISDIKESKNILNLHQVCFNFLSLLSLIFIYFRMLFRLS